MSALFSRALLQPKDAILYCANEYWSKSKLYLQLYRHSVKYEACSSLWFWGSLEPPGSINSNILDIYASYYFLSDKFPIFDDIIAPQLNQEAFSKIKFQPQMMRKSHLCWLHKPRAARYTSEPWPPLISSFGRAIHHGALTVRRGAWLQLCVTG